MLPFWQQASKQQLRFCFSEVKIRVDFLLFPFGCLEKLSDSLSRFLIFKRQAKASISSVCRLPLATSRVNHPASAHVVE